MIQVTDQ